MSAWKKPKQAPPQTGKPLNSWLKSSLLSFCTPLAKKIRELEQPTMEYHKEGFSPSICNPL
jgi:hypothetical protein